MGEFVTESGHYLFAPQKWVCPLPGLAGFFNRQEEGINLRPVGRGGAIQCGAGVVRE